MKKYFSFLMAVLAVTCVTTFTACGGDDDDDIPGSETGDITVGTHRIDVDFDGNTSGWTTTVGFSAVKASASGTGAKIYVDGKEVSLEAGVWTDNKFRSYSVSTDDKCETLCCVLYLRRNAHATAEPVTIRLKGFVNGKQKKEQTIVADASHPTKVITFYSEISGADNVQDINYWSHDEVKYYRVAGRTKWQCQDKSSSGKNGSQLDAMSKELDYYALYLRKYLTDAEDRRKDDEEFIGNRAELAAEEYEDMRRGGLTVDQAQERAMSVLMEGLN